MMSILAMYFIAVKDMAANLERKWRNQFVFMQDQVIPIDDDVQGGCYRQRFIMGPSNLLFFLFFSGRRKAKEAETS
jgi:hypothetical protein